MKIRNVSKTPQGFAVCSRDEYLAVRRFRYLMLLAYTDYKATLRFVGKSWRNRRLHAMPSFPVALLETVSSFRFDTKNHRVLLRGIALQFCPSTVDGKQSNIFFSVDKAYEAAKARYATAAEAPAITMPDEWREMSVALEHYYAPKINEIQAKQEYRLANRDEA